MTTKIISRNSPKKQSPLTYSLSEIRKKSVQTKNFVSDKNKLIEQNKTSAILEVPLINLSRIQGGQRQKAIKTTTLRSPLGNKNQQKSYVTFTDRDRIPSKRLITVSTQNSSDNTKTLNNLNQKFIPNAIIWKKKNGQLQKITLQQNVQTVSNNFLESFRVVFNELIESYFLLIFLRKKVSHLKFQIWSYILKKAGLQLGDKRQRKFYPQIDRKIFCNGLRNIFPVDIRPSQVQNMVSKLFVNKSTIYYSEFEGFLDSEDGFNDFLIARNFQKKYSSYNASQLVKVFLKCLIQFEDLETKLQMICKANEDQVIKFVLQVSIGDQIKPQKIAQFLSEDSKETVFGIKLLETKIQNFLSKTLNKRKSKYNFIKWLKVHQRLIK